MGKEPRPWEMRLPSKYEILGKSKTDIEVPIGFGGLSLQRGWVVVLYSSQKPKNFFQPPGKREAVWVNTQSFSGKDRRSVEATITQKCQQIVQQNPSITAFYTESISESVARDLKIIE